MLCTEVLDHGYVKVIRVDGDDRQIAQTARTSTESQSDAQKDARLVNRLVRDRHTSPIEFVGLVLEIQMPIFVARQWMRHRTGAFNEFSLRYSEAPDLYYVPEAERCQAQSTFNKQGSAETLEREVTLRIQDTIREHSEEAYSRYQALLADGLTRELARCVLPVNFYTKVRWKIDLHNLMHFMKLREDPHAQWEVRVYANAIHEFCSELFPEAMEAFEDHIQNVQTISAPLARYLGHLINDDNAELPDELATEFYEFIKRNFENG
jgi:thymidylate synthase (FAD)